MERKMNFNVEVFDKEGNRLKVLEIIAEDVKMAEEIARMVWNDEGNSKEVHFKVQ